MARPKYSYFRAGSIRIDLRQIRSVAPESELGHHLIVYMNDAQVVSLDHRLRGPLEAAIQFNADAAKSKAMYPDGWYICQDFAKRYIKDGLLYYPWQFTKREEGWIAMGSYHKIEPMDDPPSCEPPYRFEKPCDQPISSEA